MFFIPFKVDLSFERIPIITLLVSILCVVVYIKQDASNQAVFSSITSFCKKQSGSDFSLAMEKVAGESSWQSCTSVYLKIFQSNNRPNTIKEIVDDAEKIDAFSESYSKKYIREQIDEKLVEFNNLKIESFTNKLMYAPNSYNIVTMLTAAIAHGSWMHLIGNLFFFFAFATAIEMALGSIKFTSLLVVLALGTHLSYSLAMISVNDALPTLGLSGVVMGMIGTFAYLMPNVKIKCFLWFIWIFKVLPIPAWILALWYIGWDIYELQNANDSHINFVAHVSGAAIGFVLGVFLLRKRKAEIQEEMNGKRQTRDFRKALHL